MPSTTRGTARAQAQGKDGGASDNCYSEVEGRIVGTRLEIIATNGMGGGGDDPLIKKRRQH